MLIKAEFDAYGTELVRLRASGGPTVRRAKGNGATQPLGSFYANRKPWSPPRLVLEPERSTALRDKLLGELAALATYEEATAWAQRVLGTKNTPMTADAGLIETAFAARLAGFGDITADAVPAVPGQDDASMAEKTKPASTLSSVATSVRKKLPKKRDEGGGNAPRALRHHRR